MKLPALEDQGLYLDIGWSLVVAALVLGLAKRIAAPCVRLPHGSHALPHEFPLHLAPPLTQWLSA